MSIFPKMIYKWPVSKHMKRYSTSLVIREMQLRITRHHCKPMRMTKRQTITNVGEDVEKLEQS